MTLPVVAEAARLLLAGELVAFPTETVYGLGADAANPAAAARIFALKGRPASHPLIVHIGDPRALESWTRSVPEAARTLAERFWPGPLTLILPRHRDVPDVVTGGQDTVGVRCPSHPLAQELLLEFARIGSGGVAAPSANRFGHVSPTTAQHVREEFGGDLFVLDGGACGVGLESTIVDLSRGRPVLLRPGAITRADLAAALGEAIGDRDVSAPRASGTLAAHYAPRTPLRLLDATALAIATREGGAAEAAVLAFGPPRAGSRALQWNIAAREPATYGHELYARLRSMDASPARRILVEAPPGEAAWEAVNDRLARAAAGGGLLDDEP